MRDDQLDLVDRQLALAHRVFDHLVEALHGELVNVAPANLHELLTTGDHRRIDRVARSGKAVNQLPTATIRKQAAVNEASPTLAGPLEYDPAGAVTEQGATGALGVIGDSAERLG